MMQMFNKGRGTIETIVCPHSGIYSANENKKMADHVFESRQKVWN